MKSMGTINKFIIENQVLNYKRKKVMVQISIIKAMGMKITLIKFHSTKAVINKASRCTRKRIQEISRL